MARAQETIRKPVDEVVDGLEKAFGELDQSRAAGLGELADINEARLHALGRDYKRLEEKLGAEHPRVVALSRSIELGGAVVAELRIEQATAAVTPPGVDEKSWALHGRVLDARRRPQKGLTIGLYQGDVLVKEFGVAATDGNGYFALKASPGPESRQQHLSIRVLRDGRVIHIDDREVVIQPGSSEFREIVLGDDTIVATPPEGRKRTPPTGRP